MTRRLIVSLLLVFGFSAHVSARVIKHREPFPGRYIVVLKDSIEDDIQLIAEELSGRHRGLLRKVWRNNLKGFLIELPAAVALPAVVAEALSSDPRVAFVEEDARVQLSAGGIPDQIDRIDEDYLPMDGIYASCSNGYDVRAYIVDTGIRRDHDQFVDPPSCPGQPSTYRVQPESMSYDGVDPSAPAATDPCSNARSYFLNGAHGTSVASVIGGRWFGAARRVTLISVRVFDCFGSAWISTVISGLDWIESGSDLNRFVGNGGRVVNLSFAFKAGDCDVSGTAPVTNFSMGGLDAAAAGLVSRGITVVAAAGNFGEDVNLYSPARVSEVITAGASTSSDNLWVVSPQPPGATFNGICWSPGPASGTNLGSGVDIFAIGDQVTTADYTTLDGIRSPISGTSFAAPLVAGIAARYLQNFPTENCAAIATRIRTSAEAVNPRPLSGVPAGTESRLLRKSNERCRAVSPPCP